jgi:uncharacterized membrane protein YhaH (DUF805 family)
MTFGESIRACLSKYADFEGRAGRSEYWWFFLFTLLVQMAGSLISPILGGLIGLALLLPSIAAGARRLHDIGRTAWWLLVGLIPVIGALVLLYFFVQPSETGPNPYGDVQVPA